MAKLNPEQQQAVECINTPLLVIAGAGSGKTRLIIHKMAYLLAQGIKPTQIVAVTFTQKAAKEMKSRLSEHLDGKPRGLTISTFHHLGLTFIRQDPSRFGLNPRFSILDQEDSINILKDISRTLNTDTDKLRIYQHLISSFKNDLLSPTQALERAEDALGHQAALLYDTYENLLRAYNAVDFDDLIKKPVECLRNHPDVREEWQNRIRYLLVDEYQDTNLAQYEWIRLLTGPLGRFTMVGDDDQSIYTWRGADPQNLKRLQHDYPQLRVIKLEQNYRSTETILKAANHLISNNPHVFEKKLWSRLGSGDRIRVLSMRDEEDEAKQVVLDILRSHMKHNDRYSDYAILYRGNHQSRPFEKMLREHQMPYQISGGQSFFARPEIKDMMAYVKLMVNPQDDCSFLRIVNTPKREIGPATLEKLGHYAKMRQKSLLHACFEMGLQEHLPAKGREALERFAHHMTLTADNATRGDTVKVIDGLIAEIDYEAYLLDTQNSVKAAQKRMENVREWLSWIGRILEEQPAPTFEEVVSRLSLYDLLERQEGEKTRDQVNLMTLHAAKGLEFKHVYLVGFEEESLPHHSAIDENNIEEERRLAYVGMTRAQQRLTLTYCKTRKRAAQAAAIEPSRFLQEIPADLLDWPQTGGQSRDVEHARSHLSQLKDLLA